MHHFADDRVVLVVLVAEDAVEETVVGARVVEGDVEQVNGCILDVVAPLTSVPIQAVEEVLVFNTGAVLVVGVDLMEQCTQDTFTESSSFHRHATCTFTPYLVLKDPT